MAKQLLKKGTSLEEVASQIGYSAKFLKQELGI
jgi:lambda repressor-like predicted transcriptional regulator